MGFECWFVACVFRDAGESLVSGMVPGSAVAFKATKGAGLDNPEVLCYASKSEAMYVRDSLIFRSDSNGEDLEGYAGAAGCCGMGTGCGAGRTAALRFSARGHEDGHVRNMM